MSLMNRQETRIETSYITHVNSVLNTTFPFHFHRPRFKKMAAII